MSKAKKKPSEVKTTGTVNMREVLTAVLKPKAKKPKNNTKGKDSS